MYKGIKLRIYPNKKQRILLAKIFGCVRLIYNKALELRKSVYEKEKRHVSYKELSQMLTSLKKDKEYQFLNEVDSIALQQSLRDLDRAYKNFFNLNFGYPKFKSKKDNRKSYRTQNVNNNICVTLDCKYIKIPKLGYVRTRNKTNISGLIKNATIIQEPSGKYFCVLDVEIEPIKKPNNGGIVALDMGIKHFYTDSNGYKCENIRYLNQSLKKLKREQRRLSKKIETHITGYKEIGNKRYPIYDKPLSECRNIQKQRIKIARVYEHISNQRYDFLQKESTKLCKENQFIAVEDLNVKNMVKNHMLAKDISDTSISKFIELLDYKSKIYNTKLIKIPRFYASSQICSDCGYKNRQVKDLSVRKWTCPVCNKIHDRDINAARNILNKALNMA